MNAGSFHKITIKTLISRGYKLVKEDDSKNSTWEDADGYVAEITWENGKIILNY